MRIVAVDDESPIRTTVQDNGHQPLHRGSSVGEPLISCSVSMNCSQQEARNMGTLRRHSIGATSHDTKRGREGYTMDLEWQTVNDPLHMNNNKMKMVVFPLHLLCTRNCSRLLTCSICSLMKVVIPDLHRVTMNERVDDSPMSCTGWM